MYQFVKHKVLFNSVFRCLITMFLGLSMSSCITLAAGSEGIIWPISIALIFILTGFCIGVAYILKRNLSKLD